MGRERVPMSSKILSWDKRFTCCATEHPRISDSALFVCSSFIVTHCNDCRNGCNLLFFSALFLEIEVGGISSLVCCPLPSSSEVESNRKILFLFLEGMIKQPVKNNHLMYTTSRASA